MCKEQLYKKIDRLESTLTERAKDQDKITKALIAANEKNKKQKWTLNQKQPAPDWSLGYHQALDKITTRTLSEKSSASP